MSKDDLDELLDDLEQESNNDVSNLIEDVLALVDVKNREVVNNYLHSIIQATYIVGVEDGLNRGSYK